MTKIRGNQNLDILQKMCSIRKGRLVCYMKGLKEKATQNVDNAEK